MNKVLSKPIDTQQLKNVFKRLEFEYKDQITNYDSPHEELRHKNDDQLRQDSIRLEFIESFSEIAEEEIAEDQNSGGSSIDQGEQIEEKESSSTHSMKFDI